MGNEKYGVNSTELVVSRASNELDTSEEVGGHHQVRVYSGVCKQDAM